MCVAAPRTAHVAELIFSTGQRLAAAPSLDVHDVACEIAQQIAAGNPRRQREPLRRRRLVDAALDFEVVPIEVGETNAVADQSQVLRAQAARPNSGARIVAQPCCAKVAAGGAPRGLRGNAVETAAVPATVSGEVSRFRPLR